MVEDHANASAVQIKQLQTTIQELRSSQEELKARLAAASQPAVQKIEVVNQEPVVKGKDIGPPTEYLKAFGLYSANNYTAAITAFEAFLKRNPKSEYAANAIYWIGECYYSQSDLPKAKASFQKTIENYPKSAKMPDAMLKLGYTLAALKEKDKAQAMFESLIKKYPGSPAAVKARERLTAN
jgi:tol-pal system protein YbgF